MAIQGPTRRIKDGSTEQVGKGVRFKGIRNRMKKISTMRKKHVSTSTTKSEIMHWDVQMSSGYRGKYYVNASSFFKTSVRLVIELVTHETHIDDDDSLSSFRSFGSGGRQSFGEKSIRTLEGNALGEKDQVLFRVMFPKHVANSIDNTPNEDSDSVEGRDDDDKDKSYSRESGDDNDESHYGDNSDSLTWVNKYTVSLGTVDIINRRPSGKKLMITVGQGPTKKSKAIYFKNKDEANLFVRVVTHMKGLLSRRCHALFDDVMTHRILSQVTTDDDESVTAAQHCKLLVQIISASDIGSVQDGGAKPSPYCVVRLGDTILHKTTPIPHTLEPIWTIETKSIFLIDMPLHQLFYNNEGLTFHLFHASTGHAHSLGSITIPHNTFLDNADGKRMEFELTRAKATQLEEKREQKSYGTIAIRCRTPTNQDLQFLSSFQNKKGKMPSESTHLPLSANKDSQNVTNFVRVKVKMDLFTGETLHRVRPYPDPNRPKKETEWMTEQQIHEIALEPSKHWIEAGSGDLGLLFVEIIGCDNLPNTDIGPYGKTDSFVKMIHEDAIVNTEMVSDCLSPRFMPWTRRAFMFHITKSMSQLFVGVHDDDPQKRSHDHVGRVTVPVGTFAPDTEYILEYNLYTSANVSTRKARGSIIIRLSVEYYDIQKTYVDSFFAPRPRFHVNTDHKKDFEVSIYTIEGTPDVRKFRLQTIVSYIEEITKSYDTLSWKIDPAIKCIFLWRGHWNIQITSKHSVDVPLHSMIAFLFGVLFLEKPDLRPSLFFGCIAWFMLALLEDQRQNVLPFQRPRKYPTMISEMVFRTPKPINIEPEEVEHFVKKQDETAKQRNNKINLWQRLMEEHALQAERMGVEWDIEDVTTQTGNYNVIPESVRSVFYPHQLQLAQWCDRLRFVSSILNWEQCYISFWITSLSIFLSVVLVIFPWTTIWTWAGRFLVWTFLGPWMKLLDVFYFRQFENLSYDEQEAEMLRKKRKYFSKYMHELQVRRENVQIKASMKKHLYGKYIVSVPDESMMDRYREAPLPTSSARPLKGEKKMSQIVCESMRTRIRGQRLVGDIIPYPIQDESTTQR